MKRVIIVVIDSMGIGAMPDCEAFGDVKECNTLANVCKANNGLNLPVMSKMGLGNIQKFDEIPEDCDILLTHDAPDINNLGLILSIGENNDERK